MRISRHDVNESMTFLPYPFSKPECWNEEMVRLHFTPVTGGFKATRLQYMRYCKAIGKPFFPRMDIILLNEKQVCPCCGEMTKNVQYCVYPTKEGGLTGDVEKLNADDLAWAKAESARCWQTALVCTEFMEYSYRS